MGKWREISHKSPALGSRGLITLSNVAQVAHFEGPSRSIPCVLRGDRVRGGEVAPKFGHFDSLAAAVSAVGSAGEMSQQPVPCRWPDA